MPESKPSFRKRFFAKFMARDDQESFERYKERKKILFEGLQGRVLEIGPGTGVNLSFYPKDIEWVGVEPNAAMHPFLREKAEANGIDVDLREDMTADTRIHDGEFDFVVSTLVLCSVPRIDRTLADVHRALKRGGQFRFLEHVVDRQRILRRSVQKVAPFTPWRYFSDGCNPGRDIGGAIKQAAFGAVEYETYLQDGNGVISWVTQPHICGMAIK